MSSGAAGLAVTLMGIVLLVVASGRSLSGSDVAAPMRRRRVWLTLGGLALLCAGLCLRYESVSLNAGCPGPAAAPLSAHCYHGAPWPPHGSSR